jgi:hypothetical protein
MNFLLFANAVVLVNSGCRCRRRMDEKQESS